MSKKQYYMLPSWFNEKDLCITNPTKDGKKIITEKQYDKILYKICHSDKFISLSYLDNYIVSNQLSYRYLYLIYFLKNIYGNRNIDYTSEEAKELLKIKICDYDWKFNNIDCQYDKSSKELLLQPARTFIEKLSYYKYKLFNDLNLRHIREKECSANIMKLVDETNDIKKIIYWTSIIKSIDN